MTIFPSSASTRSRALLCVSLLATLAYPGAAERGQTPAPTGANQQLGGNYASLDARRRGLVDNWVARFNEVTGQKVEAGAFYDDIVNLSAKTTFDAVTNALVRTTLTDPSGASLGTALDLVERVDAVKGRVDGASGDRQFRMYVQLKQGAIDTLERSKEFARGADNTVYHKGYPVNYRQQGGAPSIQVSSATDGRRADIDVDYRSSSFPSSMFNGHLTSSNSDVRAGSNYDKHADRWAGLDNWWRSFFGIRVNSGGDGPADTSRAIPNTPRAGKKDVNVMAFDFLQAWLVEGNVIAAMGSISEHAYACLAQEGDDPSAFDRGVAPFQLMARLKAAHGTIGVRQSLDGLVAPVLLSKPELRPVKQPHEARFALYSVPDDVAARFSCESRLMLGDPGKAKRVYGNYFGTTFRINTTQGKGHTVALLWAKDDGYWKIVSWQAEPDEKPPALDAAAIDVTVVRIKADPSLTAAGKSFLESWLVRKNYDEAFRYLSTKGYTCYDLNRGSDKPAISPEDAGRRIRAGLEAAGSKVGNVRSLDGVVVAAEPVHPAVRVMDHPDSRVFTLSSLPNAITQAADCATRAQGARIPREAPLEYGQGFGMNIRFLTRDGEGPVLRLLWRMENDAWRITAYDVEVP